MNKYKIQYIETDCTPDEVDKHMLTQIYSTKCNRKRKVMDRFLLQNPKVIKIFKLIKL
jgi:hypothetical protein